MGDEKQEQFDPGFRIVDKRAGKPTEEDEQAAKQAESAAAEPTAKAPADEPSEAAAEPEDAADLEPLDVYGVAQYCISILSGHAWQWMGLVANPVTRKIERDLDQARIAIDCVEALFMQVEGTIPDPAARQIRQALNDLRVNFVRQSSQAP
jgi:hypothetical protein